MDFLLPMLVALGVFIAPQNVSGVENEIALTLLENRIILPYVEEKIENGTSTYSVVESLPNDEIEPIPKDILCSCVRYVIFRGLNIPPMNAKDIKPNVNKVEKGYGVLLEYRSKKDGSPISHIAIVLDVRGDKIFVEESNFDACQAGLRWLDLDDKAIRGFVRAG